MTLGALSADRPAFLRTIRAMATADDRRLTDSGIEVKPVYTAADAATRELELPGEFPFTRGPYETMYRGRPWTIRQYAGYGSAEETNARFRYLLERGQTGLSVAFDLPTQLGYDSDDPLAEGEVGRTGVAIDSLADMEALLDGIPLDRVSTSMTINAPAALLLLLYELVAEKQGVAGEKLRGTVQNDVLKEYVARGNYIFPPRPSMRLATDLFAYCAERLPRFNTISISGYHIREAGASAAQELAFTLANGIAYCEAAVAAGLSPDDFGERLSFFFNAHNHFFQEVAKFRAARRLWAEIMRDRFGATNPRALALALPRADGRLDAHRAAAGEQHRARRDPGALRASAAARSRCTRTRSTRRSRSRPSARRRSRCARSRSSRPRPGTTDTADPLGGSYFIEALTDELEQRGARAHRADRRPRRRGRGDRAGVRPGGDRGVGVPLPARGRVGRARRRRRERVHGGADASESSSCRSIPRSSGASASARRACARRATRTPRRRRSTRCATSRRPTRTSSRRCARRCARTAPSARSAASCASFGVHMTPSMRSVAPGSRSRLALIPAVAIPLAAVAMSGGTPSFTRDVAPIIAEKCAGCHQTGGIAPFPLETAKQISSRAGADRRSGPGAGHAALAARQALAGVRRPGGAHADRAAARDDRRVGDEGRQGRRPGAEACRARRGRRCAPARRS